MATRSKPEILIFVPSLKAGGMERVVTNLANYWAEKKDVIIHLATLTEKEAFYKLNVTVNLHIVHLEEGMPFLRQSLEAINQLRKLIKTIKPDAILSFGDRYNSLPIVANLFLPYRLSVSNRQSPLITNGKMVDLLNWLFYRFSDGLVAQTKVAAEIFKRKYNPKRITVIGNPFNLLESTNNNREPIILNVGRFADQKNQFELIQIFNEIKGAENWKLLFIGEGPKINQTIDELKRSNRKEQIGFLGFTDRINDFYQKAGIFCMTSRTEGFPNVIGEAMSHGLPVISYDCIAGPSELIDDGVNGFLIPEGDHELYVQRLKQLMEDEELRIRFGKNAMEKMKQFSIDNIAKQYLDFILES